jgi:hypothetical protein
MISPVPSAPTSDVLQAATLDGFRLPVIDITHPAFRLDDSPAGVAALSDAQAQIERKQGRAPKFLMRLMVRLAARKSRLVKALFSPDGDVLPGLTTYVLKLGAENLVSPYDTSMDRRLAAAGLVVSMRLRLQQTATLLAEGLRPELESRPGARLELINIAGGPAIDSLNALILLRQEAPGLLDRPITVHVLDPDTIGPAFGCNALSALTGSAGPLHGCDIGFVHIPYDWSDPGPLERLARALTGAGAIVAASSEGGLFEYGDDDEVIANLKALRAGGAVVVAGSVTRGDPATRSRLAQSRFKLKPRGIEGFAPLAQAGGFAVEDVRPALISDQVLLRPV